MGKMSSLHAESASDRADAADSELSYVKHRARIAAESLEAMAARIEKNAPSKGGIILHLAKEMREIADDLRKTIA
jgi:hypothetical protein